MIKLSDEKCDHFIHVCNEWIKILNHDNLQFKKYVHYYNYVYIYENLVPRDTGS